MGLGTYVPMYVCTGALFFLRFSFGCFGSIKWRQGPKPQTGWICRLGGMSVFAHRDCRIAGLSWGVYGAPESLRNAIRSYGRGLSWCLGSGATGGIAVPP
ncbi:hypothetical protein BDY21DRAFT_356815 [Lineolata rhizophorae]|uniref:Uncharacterized protein n=1 Tax=Lineolata rhizophorae TaxID=578093 RepID=A0A6A6NN76_9PEZI|nr:hypothetical protein BDY21DRAFT_356815 [Lineolata rhizophorae]